MLDDLNVINQHDSEGALAVAAAEPAQASYEATVVNKEHDGRDITTVVIAGMGGSALEALVLKTWLQAELSVPFDIVRDYDLPGYVGDNTLVIASSYSGNTEESLSALAQAQQKGAQVAILASGGKLIAIADDSSIAAVKLPTGLQPRMAMIYGLRGLVAILVNFGVLGEEKLAEISGVSEWLRGQALQWHPDVPTEQNYAKQIALTAVGKTPVFYGGHLTSSVAYKWKISFNETSKNTAFWNEYPEFNHNEFMGWTSHPIEKPFVIFDLISSFEHPQILKRFALSDQLLSGQRPKANVINLAGDTLIAQLLWGCILADFASIYTAVLNGVDPTPVVLIEKLKKEL